MGEFYKEMVKQTVNVDRHVLFTGNIARLCALLCLWLVCHMRLATKDRLCKFGVILPATCCFCQEDDCINHLFFYCKPMKYIWSSMLQWL